MDDLTAQSWFWWAVGLVVGVPVLIIGLGELQRALVRRGNALAGPVGLLRNWAVPVGALLFLLTRTADVASDETWVRVVATAFGFLLILFVLSALNAALFGNATKGTWRERLPGIFVDLARLLLIGLGLAVLFSWVWGADVGGLIAAFGLGSIVIGLSLQNAVGGIISGLLLLFEQPFTLGDWLTVGGTTGRVVEVNWRAVHIDTGNAIQVVPNAQLAGASFTNLSRPARDHVEVVATVFAVEDPPGTVESVLDDVAADLPHIRVGSRPQTRSTEAGGYATSIPLETYADAAPARAAFLERLWYAARRAGLHLDGADPEAGVTPERVEGDLRRVALSLHVRDDEVAGLVPDLGVEFYANGERITQEGTVPTGLRFLIEGRANLMVERPGAGLISVGVCETGDYVGQGVLTREPAAVSAVAMGNVEALVVPVAVVDELLLNRPQLAREMGETIEYRRKIAAEGKAGSRSGGRSTEPLGSPRGSAA